MKNGRSNMPSAQNRMKPSPSGGAGGSGAQAQAGGKADFNLDDELAGILDSIDTSSNAGAGNKYMSTSNANSGAGSQSKWNSGGGGGIGASNSNPLDNRNNGPAVSGSDFNRTGPAANMNSLPGLVGRQHTGNSRGGSSAMQSGKGGRRYLNMARYQPNGGAGSEMNSPMIGGVHGQGNPMQGLGMNSNGFGSGGKGSFNPGSLASGNPGGLGKLGSLGGPSSQHQPQSKPAPKPAGMGGMGMPG